MSSSRKTVDTRQEREQIITKSNTDISSGEREGEPSKQQTLVFKSG